MESKITEIVDQSAVDQIDMLNEKLLLAICRQKELNRLGKPKYMPLKYFSLGVVCEIIAIAILHFIL